MAPFPQALDWGHETLRAVGAGMGAREAAAPPPTDFGRSVNPIQGGGLCPRYYYLPLPDFQAFLRSRNIEGWLVGAPLIPEIKPMRKLNRQREDKIFLM